MRVPVCPVFTIDLTASREAKLTSEKTPRLLLVSTWPVTMLTGDCLPPPQNAPWMLAHSDGVFSVEREKEKDPDRLRDQPHTHPKPPGLGWTRYAVQPSRDWSLLTAATVAPVAAGS